MKSFQSVLGQAAGGALCNVLNTYGSSAPLLTAISLIEPTPIGEVAAVTSGLAALAAASGCEWNTDGEGPPPQGIYTGCKRFSEGEGTMIAFRIDLDQFFPQFDYTEILNANRTTDELGAPIYRYVYTRPNGTEGSADFLVSTFKDFRGVAKTGTGAVCEEPAPPATPPTPDPYNYTDQETGCQLTVNFQGWGLDQAGRANGIWKIEPAADLLRTDGGIIGGCNFEPVIYVDDGGGGGGGSGPNLPNPYAPVPPGPPPGDDWIGDLAREIVAGAAGALIADTLQRLFDAPYLGTSYRLVSVCEKDASGEPISQAVEEIIPALPATDAILSRLDALVPLLQGQKDFKQPICRDKPTLEGEWRTISFRSEETSPFGSGRLRKRFRYRSVSGFGLEQLVDYWADFSFEAGPVCVIHKGASWGTPQVWASTADEGKRVIRHAGGEAGLNPDQVGQWQISGSDNPRFGVSGTMKVDTTGGYYWITARSGSSERPIVAKT